MSSTAARAPSADGVAPAQGAWSTGTERRKSQRVALHWTLYLACAGTGHPVCTKTTNISSDGFYCYLDRTVSPGDQFECDIVVPTHDQRDPRDVVYLHCRAQAVRVEKIDTGPHFGLACRIEDYCLMRGSDQPPGGHEAAGLLRAGLDGTRVAAAGETA